MIWVLFSCTNTSSLGPSHGGAVQEVQGYQIESDVKSSGVRVWVYNPAQQQVPPEEVRGSAYVEAAGALQKATFSPDGDGLRARAKLPPGEPAIARLTLLVDGRTLEAEIRVDHVGGIGYRAETPTHGGEVQVLNGVVRVEYAAVEDFHRFWLTDVSRRPLSGAVEAQVIDGTVVLPATWDAQQACVTAEWVGAGSRTVELRLQVDGVDYEAEFVR